MLSVNEALSYEDAIGIGRKGTIDKPYLLKAPFWTVDTLFYLTVQDNMDISFVFPLLQTIRWKQLDESTGVPSLSKKTIESVMVHVPKKEEQKNLGNLFLFVDNLIAATQGKLDQLQMVKKALLQHLFDQSMRFKGYSDPWEKRKFKDIVTRVNQMSNDSKLPSVEFEDIVSGQGRLRKSAHLKFNTKKGISFQPRDVLFGKLRPYLHNWLFPNFHGRAVGDFWVLRANSNVFPGYLFQLVQAPRFQSIANISSGTKMPRSDWKTVAESHFLLPDVSEQKRIWQLFKVLDDLIAATQSKLSSLESLKKALLQGLFI